MDNKIQRYMAFLSAVECGSISQTARLLNYSQSGVSRMIYELEKEWGFEILERSHMGVRITSDGRLILPYVKAVCDDYRILLSQVGMIKGMNSGVIKIAVFSGMVEEWLSELICGFCREYPNIRYELMTGDYTETAEWILDGKADCGFVLLPTDDRLETEFFISNEVVAVMSEQHEMSSEERFPVKKLQSYPVLIHEKNTLSFAESLFDANEIRPDIRLKAWDDSAIASLAADGAGVAILPRYAVNKADGRLIIRSFDKKQYIEIGIAVRNRKKVPVAVRCFIDYVRYNNILGR